MPQHSSSCSHFPPPYITNTCRSSSQEVLLMPLFLTRRCQIYWESTWSWKASSRDLLCVLNGQRHLGLISLLPAPPSPPAGCLPWSQQRRGLQQQEEWVLVTPKRHQFCFLAFLSPMGALTKLASPQSATARRAGPKVGMENNHRKWLSAASVVVPDRCLLT